MSAQLTINVPNWLDFLFAWPLLIYRQYKFGYTFRRIYLDEGLWTIVDPQDYRRYACFKWCLDGHDGKFYAVRGARVGSDNTKKVRLHREITAAPKGLFVDHRNGDSLDNRRANLRIATRSQNMQNTHRKNKHKTTSQFVGVWLSKDRGLWCAKITSNGKKIFLGRFVNEIDAAKAYDAAARKYHGEFARLNFPEKAALPQRH
jgi:hypothetical protein